MPKHSWSARTRIEGPRPSRRCGVFGGIRSVLHVTHEPPGTHLRAARVPRILELMPPPPQREVCPRCGTALRYLARRTVHIGPTASFLHVRICPRCRCAYGETEAVKPDGDTPCGRAEATQGGNELSARSGTAVSPRPQPSGDRS